MRLLNEQYDLVFFSHVFFNSGMAVRDLDSIVNSCHSDSIVVIDGYHGFMALPTDLSKIENKAFYLAGSYKYAQGGEGACFMHCPPSSKLRPEYTGWFAELEKIEQHNAEVFYPNSALRFAGSTMDFSAVYRLISVFQLFEELSLDSCKIHNYIKNLQGLFLKELEKLNNPKRRDLQVIHLYWSYKGFNFSNGQKMSAALKRELRAAGLLKGYSNEEITRTMDYLRDNTEIKWTLETIHKYIDDLTSYKK